MQRLLCRCLLLAAVALLLPAPGQGQAPSSPKATRGGKAAQSAGQPDGSAKQDTRKGTPFDQVKLPPGTTLAIYDDLKEALKLAPRLFVLTPDEYQALVNRIGQLERQLRTERKVPAACRLRAHVEGDFVRIQADLDLLTAEPRTQVFLGCRGAQVSDARLRPADGEGDGLTPLLDHGTAGYSILLPTPGDYRLTLNLRLPVAFAASVASRGADRSFEMGLPGAAVTVLTLDLPHAVKELRLNRVSAEKPKGEATVERPRQKQAKQKRWEDVPLGPATALIVSWQEPIALPDNGPLLTARGHITVRLEEQHVLTTADLTLLDLRGRAQEWRLWLPPQVKDRDDIKVAAPEGLAHTIQPLGNQMYLLKLQEPAPDGVRVTVTVQHKRSLGRLPVGPFVVLDAFRQEGTIEVRARPAALRGVGFQLTPFGDTVLAEPPRDPVPPNNHLVVGFFRYWTMTVPPKLISSKMGQIPAPGAAPVEIELRAARGQVATRVEHRLRLRRGEEALKVHVETRIHAQPLGEAVDFLDVQLPPPRLEALALLGGVGVGPTGFPATLPFPAAVSWPGLALGARTPREQEWQTGGAEGQNQRRVRVKLPFSKESTIVLTGVYTLPPRLERIRLDLPRPLAIKDAGARVELETDESLELLLAGPGPTLPVPNRHQYEYKAETTPAFVDLAWRPYRPERTANIVADVTFHARDAHVLQQLTLPPDLRVGGQGKIPYVEVRVPPAVRGLKVGGESVTPDPRTGLAVIVLPAGAASDGALVLEYGFPLPRRQPAGGKREDRDTSFEVPLVWPAQVTQARTKVRLWTAPGTLAVLADDGPAELIWKDRGTEVVPDRGLPARVLLADGLNLPLRVQLDSATPSLAGAVVERALIQAVVDEEGTEYYRVRFLLTRLNAPALEIQLPAAIPSDALTVRLDGLAVAHDQRGRDGRVAYIPIPPAVLAKPAVLELAYQLTRNQAETEGLWQTVLHPPELLGDVFLGRVRWQVTMPSGWVPVVLGADVQVEQEWGWQGWVFAPGPVTTPAELERWLSGQAATDRAVPVSLVCSRGVLTPLRVLRPPQQAWFLVCSGALLVVGLALYFAPLSHYSFWVVLVLLGAGVVTAGALWPSVTPAVLSGLLPGAAVLVLLIGFQWMLQQRYHRQVVFMPGFKRLKPGSSLVRTQSRPREPSTVDAPAPSGQGSASGSGR